MRTGIRSSSVKFGEQFSRSELEFLSEIGFDLVELSFNAGYPDDQDLSSAKELRKAAEPLGMTFTAHAPNHLGMTSPDSHVVDEAIRCCRDVLDAAAVFGAEMLVVHACPGIPLHPEKQQLQEQHLKRSITSLLPQCEKHQIPLLIETMVPGRVTSNVETIVRIIDEVDSPWIGICLDTNHVNLSMPPEQAVRLANVRIRELHVNDNHGVTEEHLLPFDGLIDWEAFAQSLADIRFAGNWVLEPTWREGEDPRTMLPRAFQAVTRLQKMTESMK